MFERFTDRARRVIAITQEEARNLGHNYIGTEHLLLAMLVEQEGVAGTSLTRAGVGKAAVRDEIEEYVGPGAPKSPAHLPFTPRAKKVLELSLRSAIKLGHNYIGTEHLLLGLLWEGENGDGAAIQILRRMNIDLDQVKVNVMGMVEKITPPKSPAYVAPVQRDQLFDLLVKRAGEVLTQGTLVFKPGSKVAYAFVVPISARDDLADILGDIQVEDD